MFRGGSYSFIRTPYRDQGSASHGIGVFGLSLTCEESKRDVKVRGKVAQSSGGWLVNASMWCAHAVMVSSLERWIWQSLGGCDVCVAGTGGHDGRAGSEWDNGDACTWTAIKSDSDTEQKLVFSGGVARDA
eukprot:7379513-Prymnesium_polylepis.2